MSTGFGRWNEEKKQEDGPTEGSSWFGNFTAPDMESLPLFNSEAMQNFSFGNMKAAMEAQMPKKIMGMGYQQRFQVFCGLLLISALFFGLAFAVGLPMIAMRPQKFALSFVSVGKTEQWCISFHFICQQSHTPTIFLFLKINRPWDPSLSWEVLVSLRVS